MLFKKTNTMVTIVAVVQQKEGTMNPVRTFDEISTSIFDKYQGMDTITIGILIANARQPSAREHVLSHMVTFNRKSGMYIDFFIPGYYVKLEEVDIDKTKHDHPNAYIKWELDNENPVFVLDNEGKKQNYYFDDLLFDNFIEKLENEMNVTYNYKPMLVLVEVCKSHCRGELKYQKKLVIELGQDNNKSGELFNKIFEEARKEVQLDSIRHNMMIHFIKGEAVNNLISALQGDWLEAVANVANDVYKFKIK